MLVLVFDTDCVHAHLNGHETDIVGMFLSFHDTCLMLLLVGVHGPWTPYKDILVRHNGSWLYSLSYQYKDKGKYIQVVKWG